LIAAPKNFPQEFTANIWQIIAPFNSTETDPNYVQVIFFQLLKKAYMNGQTMKLVHYLNRQEARGMVKHDRHKSTVSGDNT